MSIDRWKGTWLYSAPEPGAGRKPRQPRKPREVRREPLGKSGPCHAVFTAPPPNTSATSTHQTGSDSVQGYQPLAVTSAAVDCDRHARLTKSIHHQDGPQAAFDAVGWPDYPSSPHWVAGLPGSVA